MAWLYGARRSRPGRPSRYQLNAEDEVQLDFSKATSENVHEILFNICKKQGLTEGKRFGYLNALVKLIEQTDISSGELGYTVEEIQCCLRVALIHSGTRVRASALRAVRYLLKEERDVRTLTRLQYPYLIARSLDINLRTDTERVQALRLIRRMLLLCPAEFSCTLVRSLVSLANGGAEEKDKMLRACLAVLLELCILNPMIFLSCDGVSAITRNILDAQMPKISECLCGVLLHLLDNPSTRSQANVRLQVLAAPYCDFHWSNERNREERELRFQGCRTALLSVLRSWPGILHFCHPHNTSGLKAIIDILYLKQLEVRKAILDLLYDLLGLPQPEWTDEFSVALEAVDPSRTRDSWKLADGFVAAEGKSILPHLSKFRPNIVEIHLSLLLYTFLQMGLLDALVEVIVSSDTYISLRATVLLGELLQLIHFLLPPECCNITPALPNLLFHASNASDLLSQHHALVAVTTLCHLHHMLKRRPAPASLFLDHVLQAGVWLRPGGEDNKTSKTKQEKIKLHQMLMKDTDETLKDSGVLTHKDGFSWNWNYIRYVLKSRSESLKKLEDSNCRTFLKRLVHYFKPSSNQFSRIELSNKKQTQMYTLAGCELIDCLLDAEEGEGSKLLFELLKDISINIDAIMTASTAHECFFSPQQMMSSVCQDYFLLMGRLCKTSKGMRVLDKTGIFQQLLNLVSSTIHECYVKLVISSLDYSMEGMPRIILNKVLTAASDSSRLYATQFLLVLLRAHLPDFQKWGIEFLVNQLFDQSKAVSLAAVSILSEATEEKVFLDAVVALRPSLLHLGDKGLLLLIKLFSTQTGFMFFQDANFVSTQIEKWSTTYNYRYVRIIEGEIHDAFTLHQRGEDGRYSQRVTSAKHYVLDVYVPPHLYGQLVQHEKGFQLLVKEGKLGDLFQVVHTQKCSSEQDILELKAALWGCGHIATSPAGVTLLMDEGIFSAVVQLAETCPVYSVRGTALYVLGLMATTCQGVSALRRTGWFSVRHHRHDRWPVIDDSDVDDTETNQDSSTGDDISFSSDLDAKLSRRWSSSSHASSQTDGGHFFIPDSEVESVASIDDEGLLMEESGMTERWKDFPDVTSGTPTRRKSQTLPYSKPQYIPPRRHFRSLSESKQPEGVPSSPVAFADWKRDSGHRILGKDLGLPKSSTIVTSQSVGEKSRSNSYTDSSGISSCDSAFVKHALSEHIQTLTPIPSSTSLTTLRSATAAMQASRRKISLQSSTTSERLTISPDTSSQFTQQDLLGYITVRSLGRHRRPLLSDTSSLAAAELLGFDDHGLGTSNSVKGLKARSLERQYSHPVLCEFEATLPPQLLGKSSSASFGVKPYIGSRSAISTKLCSPGNTQQNYMGIALPQDLIRIYPQDYVTKAGSKDNTKRADRGGRQTSFSEMEQVQEAAEESDNSSSTSTEDTESLKKSKSSKKHRHSSSSCLACCRLRDRKISTSSYNRHRTDTESSYGGGESPVLVRKAHKTRGISSSLLGLTPGGSFESGNSLETGSSQQECDESILSKTIARKQILKHIGRLSNPVWTRVSKQALLQLKQKFPSVYQDVCLYSEVSHRLGLSSYRLPSRRFIQELFLDLTFDSLYEDATHVLQCQPTLSGSNSSFPQSPHITVHNVSASPLSGSSPSNSPFTSRPRNNCSGSLDVPTNSMQPTDKGTGSSSEYLRSDKVPPGPELIISSVPPSPSKLVSSGGFRSPPLEIVKEEASACVSNSRTVLSSLSQMDILPNIVSTQPFFNPQYVQTIPMIDDMDESVQVKVSGSPKINVTTDKCIQMSAPQMNASPERLSSDVCYTPSAVNKDVNSRDSINCLRTTDDSPAGGQVVSHTILVTESEQGDNLDIKPKCENYVIEHEHKSDLSHNNNKCNTEHAEVCSTMSLVKDDKCVNSESESCVKESDFRDKNKRAENKTTVENCSQRTAIDKSVCKKSNVSKQKVPKIHLDNSVMPNSISSSILSDSCVGSTVKVSCHGTPLVDSTVLNNSSVIKGASVRHRKIATALPPNISTLTRTTNPKSVPSATNAARSDVPSKLPTTSHKK